MLDPRIYRAALLVVVLAVFVFAFSLQDEQGPLSTPLAPAAFNGSNAFATMRTEASSHPDRRPGSPGDDDVASDVAIALAKNGLVVSTSNFNAQTADGVRRLETVTGTLPGVTGGSIVVVAHRDALGAPSEAALSGTGVLTELARDLSGETHQRTIVLASTSGSDGAAGAAQLVRDLPGPVDAVIVLGDLAGTQVRQPIVVPWSASQNVAPPMLRNTVAAALSAQAALPSNGTSLVGQFAHLAFPFSTGEQAPFGRRGVPAVLVSLSGERAPARDEPVNATQTTALGQTVLQTINALDSGPPVPSPSPYLLINGMMVPAWAIRMLVLALMIPVLVTAIDGLARARRRGHAITPWVIWVLAGALPFVLAALLPRVLKLVGLIKVAPPGPVGAGVVPLHSAGIAVLVALGCTLVASFAVLRPLAIRVAGGEPQANRRVREPASLGAGAAVIIVMCAVTLALWETNPLAAALILPALHLWIWIVDPHVRLRPALIVGLLLAGLVPGVLVILYYAMGLQLSAVGVAWSFTLLLASAYIGTLTVVLWSVVLGCTVSVFAIALRRARADRPQEATAVTVRGPIGYASPGSLGGTRSAVRR